MSLVSDIREAVKNLKPGEDILVSHSLMFDAMPPCALTRLLPPVPEQVLNGIVGSAFEFGYEQLSNHKGCVFFRLSRPFLDGRLSYATLDRRHCYQEGRGFWAPRKANGSIFL